MSISFVFLYIAIVFLISIVRIRRTLSQVKTAVDVQTNRSLINISLITFLTELIFFFSLFTLSLVLHLDKDVTKVKECRTNLAFTINLWLTWINDMARSGLTCYMNIKFSRTLKQANDEFQVVFNENQSKAILDAV